jgi:DNA polymerase-3 subunit gamma/tau
LQTVLAVVGLVDQTLVRIRHSVHSRVLLEATLIQICTLPDLQSIADLAAAADSDGTSAPPAEKKKRHINPPPVEHSASVQHEVATSPSSAATESGAHENAAHENAATNIEPAAGPASVAALEPAAAEAEADVATSQPALTWDQPTAQRVWQGALADLESMTETFARVVEKVSAIGDQRLRLVFPADCALAMKRCELPEHKTALTRAVSRIAGKPIALEFESAPPITQPAKVEPTAKKPSRQQRMREIEANELVKSCIELFDAEIVRIDKPH